MNAQEYKPLDKTRFQKFEKKLLEKLIRPYVRWYTSQKRSFKWNTIKVHVNAGVFHPGLFFSTKILLNYLKDAEVNGYKTLELGAGSGIISIYMASKGARVLSTDINPEAIENIKENIVLNEALINENNGLVEVLESDLFDRIEKTKFDFILLNPPFYRGEIKKNSDYAWYCGPKLNFFSNLFNGIEDYIHVKTKILMIISEDAELQEIRKLADANQFDLNCVHTHKNLLETNYIFSIQSRKNSWLIDQS